MLDTAESLCYPMGARQADFAGTFFITPNAITFAGSVPRISLGPTSLRFACLATTNQVSAGNSAFTAQTNGPAWRANAKRSLTNRVGRLP